MSRPNTVIVWGEQFEEMVAVTLAITLRQAGLATEIVGVSGRDCPGRHGIVIRADLTLSDALSRANQPACVVLPCATEVLTVIDNDPRIHRLLNAALCNGARLVVHQPQTVVETSLRDIAHLSTEIICYACYPDPIHLARLLAEKLRE